MKRSTLKPDPEKVAAWQRKHRQPLRSDGPLDGVRPVRKALDRVAPKRPDPIPAETRAAARARSGGQCVACLYRRGRGSRGGRKADHLHHTFPKSKWPMLVAVEDCLVGVCFDCHMAHEGGSRRIPLLALPECVFRLAADVGPAAVDYLLRTYPEGQA